MGAKSDLIAILDGMGYPSWLMHTMPAEERYPESFFTFLAIDAPFTAFYDNRPHAAVWAFWIGFYSSDPALVESVPVELAARLQAAGWTVPGLGEDVRSDEPTHTGRRISAYYVVNYNKQQKEAQK